MPRWASRRPRWWRPTRRWPSASTFIHERIGTAAIAEQYIEGREIYVGVLGNDRRRVLPIWELQFGDLAQGARPIATEKVKHDLEYQQRHGVMEGAGQGAVAAGARPHQQHGQAHLPHARSRRLRPHRLPPRADGTPYFIEANPNPEIAKIQEFAASALHDGIKYPDLLNRIIGLGIRRAMPAAFV